MWVILGIILGIILLFLVIVLGYYIKKAYALAYKLSHPIRIRRDLLLEDSYKVEYFNYTSKRGITFSAIDIRPADEIKSTLLLCHNLGGSKESVIDLLSTLLKENCRLIGYDYVNHGNSMDCHKVQFSLREDFNLFYNAVLSRGIKGPFGIIGYSMGSTNVIHALRKYEDIKVGIIDSGPLLDVRCYFNYVLNNSKIKNYLVRYCFIWIFLYIVKFNRLQKDTIEDLGKIIDKNLLFIHGDRDNIIPLGNAQNARKYLKFSESELIIVPKSRHLTNYYLLKDKYHNTILEFLDKYLLKEDRSISYEKSSIN